MQDWAVSFYKSAAWKSMRDAIWKRDAGLCVDCRKRGRVTAAEEVHHIVPLAPNNINDPDVTLNPELLVSLCRECHKARHGARQHRYQVDEFGRVTII